MAQIFLRNDVTIFRSSNELFLRTPSLVLRFFEPRMSEALCDIASALARGQDERFLVHNFANRYTAPEIKKILELLRRYNLVHSDTFETEYQGTGHPDSTPRIFSLRGPFLAAEFRKYLDVWPVVAVSNSCDTLVEATNETALAALPETTVPVFLFSEYRREELERLNRYFVKNRRDWIAVFRFFDDVFLIPMRATVSPCFCCLPPLSLSDRAIDAIAVSATSDFTPAAAATLTSLVFRELNALYDYDSDSHRHLLRINAGSGDIHRILRLRDPLCPVCAQGSLG